MSLYETDCLAGHSTGAAPSQKSHAGHNVLDCGVELSGDGFRLSEAGDSACIRNIGTIPQGVMPISTFRVFLCLYVVFVTCCSLDAFGFCTGVFWDTQCHHRLLAFLET